MRARRRVLTTTKIDPAKIDLSQIEFAILKIAAIISLLLTLLKFFKLELSSW